MFSVNWDIMMNDHMMFKTKVLHKNRFVIRTFFSLTVTIITLSVGLFFHESITSKIHLPSQELPGDQGDPG